jgi:class 3 adenylate cyclase
MFADLVGFTRSWLICRRMELVDRFNEIFSAFDELADRLRT